MEFLNKTTIKLDRELNELDKFVFKFLSILKKFSDYVVVSGYIPILFGRSRGTEDVDLIVPKLSKEKFEKLFENLKKENFWCINTDKVDEALGILTDKVSIRFAIAKELAPNIELRFSKNKLTELALKDSLKVLIQNREIIVSSIELQIVYKEEISKGEKDENVGNKDMEDALYLRKLFDGKLDDSKIEKYRNLIKSYGI